MRSRWLTSPQRVFIRANGMYPQQSPLFISSQDLDKNLCNADLADNFLLYTFNFKKEAPNSHSGPCLHMVNILINIFFNKNYWDANPTLPSTYPFWLRLLVIWICLKLVMNWWRPAKNWTDICFGNKGQFLLIWCRLIVGWWAWWSIEKPFLSVTHIHQDAIWCVFIKLI